jgi:hypothetical protein
MTKGNQMKYRDNEGGKEDMELPIFDLAAIANAIDNFSNNKKLGEGGFGLVYKINVNITSRAIFYYFSKYTDYLSFRVHCQMREI